MNNKELNTILKSVSRSFYLSIRVLPPAMQFSVAVAYLLARAADTIADTASIDTEQRVYFLRLFREFILCDFDADKLKELNTEVTPHLEVRSEICLMKSLKEIIEHYHSLDTKNFFAVQKVVDILTQGMEKDLSTFTDKEKIVALKTDDDLEEYIYLVAGCVGEFWTDLSILHRPVLKNWNREIQIQLGIEFGKALQLTNILRDVAKDAQLGRCYFPQHALDHYKLETEMLKNPRNDAAFRPIINHWLQQAVVYFDSAENYLYSIPKNSYRLRFAALWPILIGLKTLGLIANKGNFLDPSIQIKVSRNWVYRMLFFSVFCIFSNTLLRMWIQALRSATESASSKPNKYFWIC